MLLFIDAAVRGEGVSRTLLLAEAFLAEYKKRHPREEIVRLDLNSMNIAPHSRESLAARNALIERGELSDPCFDPARQFAAADRIVIAAPFWDLSFPALLKIYIENISVGGITFGFDGNRMFGMCRCEKLAYITTRGGIFETVDEDMELALPSMRAYAKMFGLGEVVSVAAEGIDIEGCDYDGIMRRATERAVAAAGTF